MVKILGGGNKIILKTILLVLPAVVLHGQNCMLDPQRCICLAKQFPGQTLRLYFSQSYRIRINIMYLCKYSSLMKYRYQSSNTFSYRHCFLECKSPKYCLPPRAYLSATRGARKEPHWQFLQLARLSKAFSLPFTFNGQKYKHVFSLVPCVKLASHWFICLYRGGHIHIILNAPCLVKSILFIKPIITNDKLASGCFTICTVHGTLWSFQPGLWKKKNSPNTQPQEEKLRRDPSPRTYRRKILCTE